MTNAKLTYIMTTYGEILMGKYDSTNNMLHKAVTVIMQQTPQGINVGMLPTGTPLLADPNQKEFPTIEVMPHAIAWKVDLTDAGANMQIRQLRKNYEQMTSSIIMNGGGAVQMSLPTV